MNTRECECRDEVKTEIEIETEVDKTKTKTKTNNESNVDKAKIVSSRNEAKKAEATLGTVDRQMFGLLAAK